LYEDIKMIETEKANGIKLTLRNNGDYLYNLNTISREKLKSRLESCILDLYIKEIKIAEETLKNMRSGYK